jgi:hypothetical protein
VKIGRLLLLLLLVAGVCAQGGCSFILVEGPPGSGEMPVRRMDDTYCTEGLGAPIVDSIATWVVPLTLLMSMYSLGGKNVGEMEAVVKLTSALAVGGVEATSAVWGFHTVRKCRQYGARLRRD